MECRILKKWIVGIFTKPIAILRGIYYNITKQHQDLATKRLDICYKCDHCILYNRHLICEECGCILNNKTRLENEKCLMNKW